MTPSGSVICYNESLGQESTTGGYSFIMKDTNQEDQPTEEGCRMISGRGHSLPAVSSRN